jgi:16S rRNA (guanine966-N2)-methyltransferase
MKKAAAKNPKTEKAKSEKPGSLRIIAGVWRGRSIEVPPGSIVRPTSDRVREALFNRLAHAFGDEGFRLQGSRVVDVFAGTGALALEALSRGAAAAVLCDRNPQVIDLLKRNAAKLGAEDRATIMNADGAHLPRAGLACDLAFLDPPYGEGLAAPALEGLARQGWLKPGALATVETDADEPVPQAADFTLLDRRLYGRIAVAILRYSA